jgi:hypothetical protein
MASFDSGDSSVDVMLERYEAQQDISLPNCEAGTKALFKFFEDLFDEKYRVD